jgi:hypothetical protein
MTGEPSNEGLLSESSGRSRSPASGLPCDMVLRAGQVGVPALGVCLLAAAIKQKDIIVLIICLLIISSLMIMLLLIG